MSDEFDWVAVTSMDDVRPGDVVRYRNDKVVETVIEKQGRSWRCDAGDGIDTWMHDDVVAAGRWSVRRAKAKPVPVRLGPNDRVTPVRGQTWLYETEGSGVFTGKTYPAGNGQTWAEIDGNYAPRMLLEPDGSIAAPARWTLIQDAPPKPVAVEPVKRGDMVKAVGPGQFAAVDKPAVKAAEYCPCPCGRALIPPRTPTCWRCDEEAARKCAPGCNPGAPCMGAVCPGHKEGELLFNGALQPFVCAAEKTAPLRGNDPGHPFTESDHWRARRERLEADRTRGPVAMSWGRVVIR